MGAKALEPITITKAELDQTFLAILTAQCQRATEEAGHCTGSIFNLTSKYLNQPEFEVLQQFYDLYFVASGEMESKKQAINDDVDDLVSMLQEQLARGEELSAPEENEARKQERLSLSAIQKKLEGLITLDSGIRDQVLPALASMQFEDAVRQRIDHLVFGWDLVVHMLTAQGQVDWQDIAREIGKKTSSVEEANDFYRDVLNEEAPAGSEARSTFIEF